MQLYIKSNNNIHHLIKYIIKCKKNNKMKKIISKLTYFKIHEFLLNINFAVYYAHIYNILVKI